MHPAWWAVGTVTTLAVVFLLSWPLWCRRRETRRSLAAKRQFHLRREWLEAEFVKTVTASGRPRGLTWDNCDFEDPVYFAIDRQTGVLRAFVAVSISFQAIEGEDLEHNPNVSNVRAATAVFGYEDRRWRAEGRALFNLAPREAAERFGHELEPVETPQTPDP